METIEALGETIVPGARAAGIAHFIDQQLSVPLEEALLETRSPATITSAKAMTPAIDEPQLERDPHLPLHYFDRRRSRLQRSGSHKTRRWRRQSRANPSLNAEFPASREFTGNFIDSGIGGASEAAKKGMKSVSYGPIPYAS